MKPICEMTMDEIVKYLTSPERLAARSSAQAKRDAELDKAITDIVLTGTGAVGITTSPKEWDEPVSLKHHSIYDQYGEYRTEAMLDARDRAKECNR